MDFEFAPPLPTALILCKSCSSPIAPSHRLLYDALAMDNSEYDRLRQAYKDAVDQWVAAIRDEEALATPNHSMIAMERWDAANFREQDAQKKVMAAKDAYKDALRLFNYGI